MYIRQKQQEDLKRLSDNTNEDNDKAIEKVLNHLSKSLQHNDIVQLNKTILNLPWIETYLATLRFRDHSIFRSQMLHFDIANSLSDILERRLQSTKAWVT